MRFADNGKWTGLPCLLASLIAVFAATLPAIPAHAAPLTNEELCETGQCPAMISVVKYQGRTAYRLSDGRSEVVVSPEIGRIMRYALVGGPNLLWNATPGQEPRFGDWVNYGGSETWLGPQNSWAIWHARGHWPPDPAFDGKQGDRAEVITGGKLRLTSPLSPGTGITITRDMYFAPNGDFVIDQSATKSEGAPVQAALWNISQVAPGEAFFVPINPNSPYKKNFHWMTPPNDDVDVTAVTPSLLRVVPTLGGPAFKLGADAPAAALATLKDHVVFLQQAKHAVGEYPDGATGAGFPVELFVHGDKRAFYAETELFSPLLVFRAGTRWQQSVRWSLHALPEGDIDSPQTWAAIDALLTSIPGSAKSNFDD
jgi:hypothetical protein